MSAGRVVIWLASGVGKGFALTAVVAVSSAVGGAIGGGAFKAGQWWERRKNAKKEAPQAGTAKPWLEPNNHGEKPGDICCQRSAGEYCYEHDPKNYKNGKLK